MREKAEKPAKRKLTRAERKQIEAVIRQAKGDGKAHTVQDSIPFQNMFPDGLCRLEGGAFSKTIAFEDVNYRLAGPEDQRSIFESLCDFYNGYDPSIGVQVSLDSRSGGSAADEMFGIRRQGNDLDPIRDEAVDILRMQYKRGNNGYVKTKYVTLTIEAENLPAARARFARIETDTLNRFKVMGAAAHVLDGKERLELLYNILHPEGGQFAFEWDWLPASGLSVKDFISPSSFHFGETRTFRIGKRYGAVSFLQILAPEMHGRILTDFMEADGNIMVTMHIRGINQNEAIKMVKRKITDLDAMKIQEQKRAVRSGYDMDILPSDLSTYGGAAKDLLTDLQSRNERMFNMTFLVLHTAETRQKLEIAVSQAASVAQTYNCLLTRLDFQQEDGLMSSLPLGLNRIKIERSLTTSALAVFVPFVTQEVFMGGDAMYYGLNALSNNMILLDRKQSRCPNGLVFGTPGSGKSMSVKMEIIMEFLRWPNARFILVDPENEYELLVKALGGEAIKVSVDSRTHFNPLDYHYDPKTDVPPDVAKIEFVLSMLDKLIGENGHLQPEDRSLIAASLKNIYKPLIASGYTAPCPTLGDLYRDLNKSNLRRAKQLALMLDVFANGSLQAFSHTTNVDMNNRLICFNIQSLGDQLRPIAMMSLLEFINMQVMTNRRKDATAATWIYFDEIHVLLKDPMSSNFLYSSWKRFRKYNAYATGISQDIQDYLDNPVAYALLSNSEFVIMLRQSKSL